MSADVVDLVRSGAWDRWRVHMDISSQGQVSLAEDNPSLIPSWLKPSHPRAHEDAHLVTCVKLHA